jgi:hypothetical protein
VREITENSPIQSRTDDPDSPAREDVDLSAESVITIQPDGRVHLFGVTRAAVEVLASIPCGDPVTRRRLSRMLGAGKAIPQDSPDSASSKEAL